MVDKLLLEEIGFYNVFGEGREDVGLIFGKLCMKGSVRLPRPPVIEQYLFYRFIHLFAVWLHIPLAVKEARVLRNSLGKVDERLAHFVFADDAFRGVPRVRRRNC